jgi:L-rhamnose 1-dehydrogenase
MAPASWRLLKGKTACKTGGTTGIGRAIALEFIRQGCHVAVNHLGLPQDEELKNSLVLQAQRIAEQTAEFGPSGELLEVAGDVTDPETSKILIEKAVERWGGIDVFVGNAGIFTAAQFLT